MTGSIGVEHSVFIDFDGTIAPVDTTDLLLEQFADPAWHAVEDEWRAGVIGSRECLARQVDLIRATPQQMDAFVREIEIDPGLPDFIALCRLHGMRATVVSDGLDRTVGAVLARFGIDVPYFANHLEWVGDDRWRLTFPHARGDCRALSGNCKCQFAEAVTGSRRILVGDGRSDFCIAERVDMVLAKGSLVAHCRSSELPHFAFTKFDEATRLLEAWLRVGHDTLDTNLVRTDE